MLAASRAAGTSPARERPVRQPFHNPCASALLERRSPAARRRKSKTSPARHNPSAELFYNTCARGRFPRKPLTLHHFRILVPDFLQPLRTTLFRPPSATQLPNSQGAGPQEGAARFTPPHNHCARAFTTPRHRRLRAQTGFQPRSNDRPTPQIRGEGPATHNTKNFNQFVNIYATMAAT